MTVVGALAAAALAVATVVFGTRPVLARLPEPIDPTVDKVAYRDLASWTFLTVCGLLSGVLTAASWLLLPVPVRPAWWVLGTAALLLAAVDAHTTWLPRRLTYLTWVAMAGAAALGAVLAGMAGSGWLALLGRTVLGAVLAGALYLLVWAVSKGGFGFGDVRFAPLVGAAAGAHSFTLVLWALVLGTVIGAGHGLVRLARRRRGPFPYAPSILAGGYLAVAADWLAT